MTSESTIETTDESKTDEFFAQPLKHQFIAALGNLPDDLTLDDAIDCLILVSEVNIGIKEIQAGKGIPHDEVMKHVTRRWRK